MLWQGGWRDVCAIHPNVEHVISLAPLGGPPADPAKTKAVSRELSNWLVNSVGTSVYYFYMLDTDRVSPEDIDSLVSRDAPTFIHCNAGVNRSVMLTCCYLLHHGYVLRPEEAYAKVGTPAYSEMRENVQAYHAHVSIR